MASGRATPCEVLRLLSDDPPRPESRLHFLSTGFFLNPIQPRVKTTDLHGHTGHKFDLHNLGHGLSLSELCHENSKLRRYNAGHERTDERLRGLQELHAASPVLSFGRYMDPGSESLFLRPVDTLPGIARTLCGVLGDRRLGFALEAFILLPSEGTWHLRKLIPQDGTTLLVRQPPPADVRGLEAAFPRRSPWSLPEEAPHGGLPMALFLVGAIGRLYQAAENRAYRLAAHYAGVASTEMRRAALDAGAEAEIHENFLDEEEDRFLNADGSVHATLAVLTVSQGGS